MLKAIKLLAVVLVVAFAAPTIHQDGSLTWPTDKPDSFPLETTEIDIISEGNATVASSISSAALLIRAQLAMKNLTDAEVLDAFLNSEDYENFQKNYTLLELQGAAAYIKGQITAAVGQWAIVKPTVVTAIKTLVGNWSEAEEKLADLAEQYAAAGNFHAAVLAAYNQLFTRVSQRIVAGVVIKTQLELSLLQLGIWKAYASLYVINNTIAAMQNGTLDDKPWVPDDQTVVLSKIRHIFMRAIITEWLIEKLDEINEEASEQLEAFSQELAARLVQAQAKWEDIKQKWQNVTDVAEKLRIRALAFLDKINDITVTASVSVDGRSVSVTFVIDREDQPGETNVLEKIKSQIKLIVAAWLNAAASDVSVAGAATAKRSNGYTVTANISEPPPNSDAASAVALSVVASLAGVLAMII